MEGRQPRARPPAAARRAGLLLLMNRLLLDSNTVVWWDDGSPIHRDPFGRLLVAVAAVDGLAMVSSPILSGYPISFIDARS